MIRIFIGYDKMEPAAYHVLSHSIMRRATEPVSISPIKIELLKNLYRRPRASNHSTEFSLSRFLVPYLCDYQGWAIFMDCDMLCLDDISKLWALRDERFSVQVCRHDYEPRSRSKMLGSEQTFYEKKNWSSLMLLNCMECSALTPAYVNAASGLELHQFKWLSGDDRIGALPYRWNWLAGEYEHHNDVSIVHYTLGGPWWSQYVDCDYAKPWHAERKMMTEDPSCVVVA